MVKIQKPAEGIAIGLDGKRGRTVTALKKGKKTKRNVLAGPKGRKFVKAVIRETVGFAPYERRIMDLLKLVNNKRALKLAKARLGTHKRAKAKRSELENAIMEIGQRK